MASLRLVVLAAALFVCAVQGRTTRGIGEDTDITKAPWLVQIEFAKNPGVFGAFGGTCGGSILDSTHILTAAHCFDPENVESPSDTTRIRAGATTKWQGGVTYTVKSIDSHPDYKIGKTNTNDLAVMTLAEPIQFNDNVQPISFATEADLESGVFNGGGWGVINEDNKFAPGLQTFTLTKQDANTCQSFLNMGGVSIDELVCYLPLTGLPCGGDSGSGLWVPAQGGNPAKLVGVLHAGTACDTSNGIVFYINIFSGKNRPFLSKHFDMSGTPSPRTA